MTTQRKGFWRGFTWKRFGWNTLFLFVLAIAFVFLDNYTDRGIKPVYITLPDIGKAALISCIFGLIASLWQSAVNNKRTT